MKKNDRNVCVFPCLDPPILPGFPSSFLSFPLSSLCAFSSTHLIFFSTLPVIFIHFSHACSSCSPLCVSVCLHIDKLLLILEKDTLHVVHSMRYQHKRLQHTHTHAHRIHWLFEAYTNVKVLFLLAMHLFVLLVEH